MSSSSLFSSSSSSLSSADSPPSFPSSATSATSRQRRKRRDAISRAAESEWDAPPSTASPAPLQTITLPPWRRADELICPLSPSDAPLPPYALLPCFAPFTPTAAGEDETDELQAMLARFSFPSPSPSPSSRKHRRSGEVIDHSSAAATSDEGTGNERGTGPVRRAPCAHCESGQGNI